VAKLEAAPLRAGVAKLEACPPKRCLTFRNFPKCSQLYNLENIYEVIEWDWKYLLLKARIFSELNMLNKVGDSTFLILASSMSSCLHSVG